jgi:hypothetical protein
MISTRRLRRKVSVESFEPARSVDWAKIGAAPIDLNRDEVLLIQRRQCLVLVLPELPPTRRQPHSLTSVAMGQTSEPRPDATNDAHHVDTRAVDSPAAIVTSPDLTARQRTALGGF